MKKLSIISVILCLMFSGCVAPTNGKHIWNPLTWFSDSKARAVERVEEKRSLIEDLILHHATIESFKTTTALNSSEFTQEKQLQVGRGLADNTFNLLNGLSPVTFGELQEARTLTQGLLSDRADALKEQARLTKQYGEQSQELAAVKKQLGALDKAAKNEAEKNLNLANQLRNEQFIKYASLAGNGLLLIAVFAYRMNLGGLQTGIGNALGKMQSKFGANDEDLLAIKNEIDAKINTINQAAIAKVVGKIV